MQQKILQVLLFEDVWQQILQAAFMSLTVHWAAESTLTPSYNQNFYLLLGILFQIMPHFLCIKRPARPKPLVAVLNLLNLALKFFLWHLPWSGLLPIRSVTEVKGFLRQCRAISKAQRSSDILNSPPAQIPLVGVIN